MVVAEKPAFTRYWVCDLDPGPFGVARSDIVSDIDFERFHDSSSLTWFWISPRTFPRHTKYIDLEVDSQKDFSKYVNNCEPGLMACSIGFDAGLGLGFGLNMGKRVHTPIGVREAVYPRRISHLAVYLRKAVYGCKPLYLYLTLYLGIPLYL